MITHNNIKIQDVPGKTFADFVSGSKSSCSPTHLNPDHSSTTSEGVTENDSSIVFRKDSPKNLTVRQRCKLEGVDSDDNLLSLNFGKFM